MRHKGIASHQRYHLSYANPYIDRLRSKESQWGGQVATTDMRKLAPEGHARMMHSTPENQNLPLLSSLNNSYVPVKSIGIDAKKYHFYQNTGKRYTQHTY